MFLKIRMIHRCPMFSESVSKRMISDLNIFIKTSPLQVNTSSGSKYSMKTISHGLIFQILMPKSLLSKTK